VTSVWGFKFEGKRIDLIGLQENDDEDFPFEVIRSFDYGINMVYDNGSYVDTECLDYRSDRDNHYMSLVNLHDIKGLPKAIKRFEIFNERQKKVTGEDLVFRAPCLELKGKKEKKEYYNYGKMYGDDLYTDTVSGTFVREELGSLGRARPMTMRTVDVGEGLSAFSSTVAENFTVEEVHPDPSWTTTMSGGLTVDQVFNRTQRTVRPEPVNEVPDFSVEAALNTTQAADQAMESNLQRMADIFSRNIR
jgi:hypothetical protein